MARRNEMVARGKRPVWRQLVGGVGGGAPKWAGANSHIYRDECLEGRRFVDGGYRAGCGVDGV